MSTTPFPEPQSEGQRKMADSYQLARALFEADRLGPQAQAVRWDRDRAPGRTLAEATCYLMGSLGRLAGGASLGDQTEPTAADIMDGWLKSLWFIGILAATHRLAVEPLLAVADDLALATIEEVGIGSPPSIIASCVDLTVIATESPDSPASPEVAESMRRAMFGALGNIATVAIVWFIRTMPQRDALTVGTFYTAAVETITGEKYAGAAVS